MLLSGQALGVAKPPAPGSNGHLQGMGAVSLSCPTQSPAWPIGLSTRVWEERRPLGSTDIQGGHPEGHHGNPSIMPILREF